ncbi:hypothetical protein ZHAS_00010392 [Anopheles sinensis]|uniref:Uncharacterized protein n=1 Tax=Anopheles sinensis TaxID=74873 RepID=A0A084VXG6_ANOSI|nr:hypothetical protein ZHAS_00010392 [Anopheles sinensis]
MLDRAPAGRRQQQQQCPDGPALGMHFSVRLGTLGRLPDGQSSLGSSGVERLSVPAR